MYLRVVDEDLDWVLEISMDAVSREALLLQSLRDADPQFRERVLERLRVLMPLVLAESLDPGLQRPTERQLNFAIDIASSLGVAIPGEAFRFREAMAEFIARHRPAFEANRTRN